MRGDRVSLRRLSIFVVALALALANARPLGADGGLEAAVGASFMHRSADGNLQSIAHQRVVEISCAGCFNHAGMRAGTAEVIAWNLGKSDPVGAAVGQWQASPVHNRILSDASLGRIGCASTLAAGTHFFVCVLASGGSTAAAPAPPPPPPPAGSAAQPAGGAGALPAQLPDTSTGDRQSVTTAWTRECAGSVEAPLVQVGRRGAAT